MKAYFYTKKYRRIYPRKLFNNSLENLNAVYSKAGKSGFRLNSRKKVEK